MDFEIESASGAFRMTRKSICIIATVPYPLLVFMREHVAKLSEYYDVTLICSGDGHELIGMLNDRVKFISVRIERKIAIFADILALASLLWIFYRHKFDCVHSLMPKSALLAMVAAWLVRTKVRIHIFTGQVWVAKTGLVRLILVLMDKLVSACATNLLADSPSQRDFLIAGRIVKPGKIRVLAKGSISGVDVNRFKFDIAKRLIIREKFGVRAEDVIFLYLARLTRVKGIVDLTNAFVNISNIMPNAHLMIVGPDEEKLIPSLEKMWVGCRDKIHRVNFTNQPENYMSAADIFCLPSYLEGFSSATIQAAGVGLPAIVSRIYGLTDAVQSGVTGIFHEAGSIAQMQDAMKLLYTDKELRKKMGGAAHRRAYEDFSQELVVEAMRLFYEELLGVQTVG
jgi:glycosyltransferase involved in cell wall biosynthesis